MQNMKSIVITIALTALLLSSSIHCFKYQVAQGGGSFQPYRKGSTLSTIANIYIDTAEPRLLLNFYIPTNDFEVLSVVVEENPKGNEQNKTVLSDACAQSKIDEGTDAVTCVFENQQLGNYLYIAVLMKGLVSDPNGYSFVRYSITGSTAESPSGSDVVLYDFDNSQQPQLTLNLQKQNAVVYNPGNKTQIQFSMKNEGVYTATNVVVDFLTSNYVSFESIDNATLPDSECKIISSTVARCTYKRINGDIGDETLNINFKVSDKAPYGTYPFYWQIKTNEIPEADFGYIAMPVQPVPKDYTLSAYSVAFSNDLLVRYSKGQQSQFTLSLSAVGYAYIGEAVVAIPHGLKFVSSSYSGCIPEGTDFPVVRCKINLAVAVGLDVQFTLAVTSEEKYRVVTPYVYLWNDHDQFNAPQQQLPIDYVALQNSIVIDNSGNTYYVSQINLDHSTMAPADTNDISFFVSNQGPSPINGVIAIQIPANISVVKISEGCELSGSVIHCNAKIDQDDTYAVDVVVKNTMETDFHRKNQIALFVMTGKFRDNKQTVSRTYAAQAVILTGHTL
jgi:hypothetical protein